MTRLGKVTEAHSVDEVLQEVITARAVGTDVKELFGGPRDWVDSALPPAVFVITNIVSSLTAAIWAAIVVEVLVVLVRLVRRETLRHAFSGAFGVALCAFIALKTGDAKNFFLPGIVINVVYGLAFLASVLFGKPVVGLIMRFVVWSERPASWHDHPVVRRAYTEATVGWALMFVVRAAVQGTLWWLDMTALLGVSKIAMGYPLYIAVLALTMPYVKRRTASVPVPEPEPEAGGEDAGDDAAEPVAEGL